MYRSNTDEKRKGKTMKRLFAVIMMLLTELEANGTTVTLKGDAGQYTLAIWTDGRQLFLFSQPVRWPESQRLADSHKLHAELSFRFI